MKYLLQIILFLLLIAGAVGCEVYKYKDCKNVGHKTGYCILKLVDSK